LASAGALKQLAQRERHISSEINAWFASLKTNAIRITLSLQEVERQATLAAFVLGAVGAILGVLTTVWSILTLRPLRRLHEAVRKVAGGNYRQQVEVSGGTEVADLAREFNAMAAALSQREQELVRSERLAAVGKMAAVITHEVRNPLSSIGLNAELLEEEVAHVSPEAVALSRAVQKEVDRLTAITEEYLRFARLPRPRLEREQVNSIVAGVVEFQREDLLSRGVRVEAQLAEALPPVDADEAQLRQALLNLLRNAADAMTSGGALTVATRQSPDGAVEVSVQDTGPGISDEHLHRIFEPFFSTKDGGTGLGLALTQQIVTEHGGRIIVDSRPGTGTTFTLRLPAALSA
jgi:signal transduction histidine kinase